MALFAFKRMKTLLVLLTLVLAGCSSLPTPAERIQLADELAATQDWRPLDIAAGGFHLRAYLPSKPAASDELTIYLEGDGLAWVTGDLASDDPTPRDPLALRLALAHPDGAVAYLARPCQYVGGGTSRCNRTYWTDGRFSGEVVAATNMAIDELVQRFSAKRLTLVGYSGGGAVAALLSARRTDVVYLVTVAGNLDHRSWTRRHRLSPLTASLDPLAAAADIKELWQWHLLGSRDTNITPEFAKSFILRSGAPPSSLQIVDGFDHHCCWGEHWAALWQTRRHRSMDSSGTYIHPTHRPGK